VFGVKAPPRPFLRRADTMRAGASPPMGVSVSDCRMSRRSAPSFLGGPSDGREQGAESLRSLNAQVGRPQSRADRVPGGACALAVPGAVPGAVLAVGAAHRLGLGGIRSFEN